MSASIWRGFSDFGERDERDERDEEILGYPTCEACGWQGAPLVTASELQDGENWAHHCHDRRPMIPISDLIAALS